MRCNFVRSGCKRAVHPDDIMRARIQTMGVAEHEFEISLGPKIVKWLLYDVGGARGQVRCSVSWTILLFIITWTPIASHLDSIF